MELDASHAGTHLVADVTRILAPQILELFDGERPDFVWASPPCQVFSVLRIGHYWINGGRWPQPRTERTREGMRTVAAALALIRELQPRYWLAENPRAMLRKIELMRGIPRRTVTYCQYGDTRQKPTDLFGPMPSHWHPRAMCRPSAPCHEASPRGSKNKFGTCGLKDAAERSKVPYQLGLSICAALEGIGL